MSNRQDALQWLDENAAERPPVFVPNEIPEDVLLALRRSDLVIKVAGGVLVVRTPGDEPTSVIRSLLWPIIEALTRIYAPAVVERDSAVRLYLGKTDPGPEIRIRQTGQTRWRETIDPGVTVRVERGEVLESREVEVGEARIPVDPPETVLLMLSLAFLRDGLGDVALWMKSLVLSRPALVDAYRRWPRPLVLKRMEHIAQDVGNQRLAELIGAVLREEQGVRIGRDRTGVGRELIVPSLIARVQTTREAWLDRLRVSIRRSLQSVRTTLATFDLPEPSVDLDSLLMGARGAKAYDAYHSSSIEGYRLSLDEVWTLLGGGPGGAADIEDLRSRLAVIGYGIAFDRLVMKLDQQQGTELTGSLALDLYGDLFTPSVEAGVVAVDELRGWRRSPVFIRNTLFVPPGAEKVSRMVDLLFEEIAMIDVAEGLIRAILVHLWFVWIHPFPDGNGRVARFLMNAALIESGLPWLTIRVEQRAEYFAGLKSAQMEEDYAPFARFIADSLIAARH